MHRLDIGKFSRTLPSNGWSCGLHGSCPHLSFFKYNCRKEAPGGGNYQANMAFKGKALKRYISLSTCSPILHANATYRSRCRQHVGRMETKIQYCSWWSRPKSDQSSQPQASPLSLDDQELLNLIHKQKSLHRRISKSAHKNSELIARHRYRALRNKTNNLYRRLRNSHFKERLLLYRTSPRQLWTTIKYITNKQRLPLQVPVPLNDLSRYFERLLQQPGEYITLPYGPNNINSLQTFVPVTPTEFEGLLSQLNPWKSPGPDMISPFELKMVKQQISTQL